MKLFLIIVTLIPAYFAGDKLADVINRFIDNLPFK